MTGYIKHLAILILFALFLSACGGTQTLTKVDDGQTVELKAGDTLIIELQGNPSTGFSWELFHTDETILRLVGEPEFTQQGNMLGSGGTFTFTFEAVDPGETSLVLVYHRPWEVDTAPEDTFELTVQVR